MVEAEYLGPARPVDVEFERAEGEAAGVRVVARRGLSGLMDPSERFVWEQLHHDSGLVVGLNVSAQDYASL